MNKKVLAWLLRISGAILLTALLPAVMPFSWMQAIHHQIGMGELPTGPIIGYLTRSLSLFYAYHGALLIYVSLDIGRYQPFVKFLAVLSILFGIAMFILDFAVGMPLRWIWCEGPLIVLLGIVILRLAGRVPESNRDCG